MKSRRRKADSVRFFVPDTDRTRLEHHPWRAGLEAWDWQEGVRLLTVKSGLSRHIVRFVEADGERYAVKETTVVAAFREDRMYRTLHGMGIPSLQPVGVVVRDDGSQTVRTSVGLQLERRETAFLVTRLHEKVIPDSHLYRRGFTRENRHRIWDAIVTLFVSLHAGGVFWGDASLANMLVHFMSERVPHLGQRTRLRAVLADAETVEIHPSLSDRMRQEDMEFFLESMLWTEADLRASGVVRDPIMTGEDQEYLRHTYAEAYSLELEQRSFELVTRIDVDTLLGSFDVRGYGKVLLQHIQEHRWYLGERRGVEVPLSAAAEDWYRTIFRPVCRLFQEHGLLSLFPEKTAASLYVEIMEHKYYMSQPRRKDVGLRAALQDFVRRFAPPHRPTYSPAALLDALGALFRGVHNPLFR